MKNISIKNTIAAVALVVATTVSATAQDLTSYFVTSSTARMEHNAAFAPDRGYFNIPLVGSMSLSTSGNVSLDKLLFPMDGSLVTIFDTRISADDALANLSDINVLGLSSRMSILGFGSYSRDRESFWNFDLSLRMSGNTSMPYEFFEFFKTAPEYSSFSDVNFAMESYIEASFGYSRRLDILDKRLSVGARVKVLGGLFRSNLNINQMDVTLSGDEWIAKANGTMDLYANGMTLEEEFNDDGEPIYNLGGFDGSFSGLAGAGFGLDFGATFDYSKRMRFSVAVNDLGFISWKAKNNTHATVANEFSFAGAQIDADSGSVSNSDDIVKMDDIELVPGESRKTKKSLQSYLNAGAEYDLFNHLLGVGGIYTIRLWDSQTLHNIAIAATLRPTKWLTFAANYNISTNTNNTVGLAANFATGFLNLYLATDVLASRKTPQYIPIDQSVMNVSFGLAVPLGKKGNRNDWANRNSYESTK